jgi:hypothetical protein
MSDNQPVKEENMKRKFVIGPTLAALLFVGMLLAPVAAFSQNGDRLPSPLQEKEYQGVPYISGGVGEGERGALRQLQTKYNLKVEYSVRQGNYLALVDTVIKNAQGKTVLDATAQGPWLYAKLPAGKYTIKATTLRGKTQELQVEIPQQGLREITFTWKRAHVHE